METVIFFPEMFLIYNMIIISIIISVPTEKKSIKSFWNLQTQNLARSSSTAAPDGLV